MLLLKALVYPVFQLQQLLIDSVASQQMFSKDSVCPLAKPDATLSIHPESYGDYHIKIVVGQCSCYGSSTFSLNCSEIPNSCPLLEFFLLKYISNMLADISLARLKQLNNLRLSQPDRLVLQTHLKTDRTIGLIKYYFSANLFIPNTNQLVRIT